MTAAIELDRVRLAIAGRTILSNVSISIQEGELVGVLGANGSGKTTLMRALLGLLRPASGTIRILGAPQERRGNPAIGYMPQFRTLAASTRLSAFDFVASALDGEKWGLPAVGRRNAEVERAIAAAGASDLAHRPISELSGGQRQRLLIAQALLGRPKLLLLDEPLSNLDPHFQQEMVALVDRLRRELGLTVLFSAHDVNQLLGVMDRVLYLGGGAAALGTLEEVVTGPVLSRLYGTAIDVVRLPGRIFVLSAGNPFVEGGHDHHHHEHHHH